MKMTLPGGAASTCLSADALPILARSSQSAARACSCPRGRRVPSSLLVDWPGVRSTHLDGECRASDSSVARLVNRRVHLEVWDETTARHTHLDERIRNLVVSRLELGTGGTGNGSNGERPWRSIMHERTSHVLSSRSCAEMSAIVLLWMLE